MDGEEWWWHGQVVRLPAEASLMPKVHVNLGIALEGQDRLLEACSQYRWAPYRPCLPVFGPCHPPDWSLFHEREKEREGVCVSVCV